MSSMYDREYNDSDDDDDFVSKDREEDVLVAKTALYMQLTQDITKKEIACWGHTWQIAALVGLMVFLTILDVFFVISGGAGTEYPDNLAVFVRHKDAEQVAMKTQTYLSSHWLTATTKWILVLNLSSIIVSFLLIIPLVSKASSFKLSFCWYACLLSIVLNLVAFFWRVGVIWFIFSGYAAFNILLNFFLLSILFVCFYDIVGWLYDIQSLSIIENKFNPKK